MFEINHKEIKQARWLLERLHFNRPDIFENLFIKGKTVNIPSNIDTLLLEESGIIEKDSKSLKSHYMIYHVRGNFILTDLPSLRQIDRVFPIYEDESIFLSNQLTVKEGEVGLDIGTGSGIYAVVAAQKAKHVIATDVNNKVEKYVKFNAIINGVNDRIEFLYSDVYEDLNGEKFDFIFSNPPFVPLPPQSNFYIHSAGGSDGLEIVRRILFDCHKHLKLNGRLQMLTLSLGKNRSPIILNEIKSYLTHQKVSISHEHIYDQSLNNLKVFINKFKTQNNFQQWKTFLFNEGFNALYYLYLNYVNNGQAGLFPVTDEKKFLLSFYSGNWKARLNRYSMPELYIFNPISAPLFPIKCESY